MTTRRPEPRSLAAADLAPAEPFMLLAESIPQLVWTARPDGRLDYANRRWAEYTGVDEAGVQGWQWKQFLYPDDLRGYLDLWTNSLDRAAPFEVECRLRRGDGAYRWFLVRAAPILGREGLPACWFGTCTDINGQKQEQNRLEERFRASVDNLLDCFGIFTAVRGPDDRIADFRVEYVNPAACANNRLTLEQQVGRGLLELLPAHRESGLFDDYCRVVETGEPVSKEMLFYEDSYAGRRMRRWFDIRASKLGDGFVAAWREVTERVEARRAAGAEEARRDHDFTRRVLDSLFAFVAVLEPDGTLLDVNEAPLRAAGIAAEEVRGKKLWDTYWGSYSEDVRQRVRSACEQAARGETVRYRETARMAGGELMPLDFQIAPLRDASGRVTHLVPSAVDAAGRERAEAMFRRLAEANVVGIGCGARDGTVTYVNDEMLRMMGYTRADYEAGRVNWAGSVAQEYRADIARGLEALARDGSASGYQREFLRPDGGRTPYLGAAASLGPDGSEHVSVAVDLTPVRSAERALRESEGRFRAMADGLPLILWLHDAEGRQEFVNRTFCEYFGVNREEMGGEKWVALTHPEDSAAYVEEFRAAVRERTPFYAEVRVLRGDGDWRWLESWGQRRFSEAGEYLGHVGAGADVTERKRAEFRAEEQRGQLQAVFQAMADGVVVFDAGGRAVLVNDAEARLVGYPDAASMRRDMDHFASAFELEELDGTPVPVGRWPVSRVLAGESLADLELRVRRKDTGREWVIAFSGEPVRDDRGRQTLAVIVSRDVTQRRLDGQRLRESEERLRLAQKVARVGTFEWDIVSGANTWSPELEALYGLPPGGFRGTYEAWAALVHPDDLPATERLVRESLGRGDFEGEWRAVWPDGTVRWLAARGRVFHDAAGNPQRMLGVNLDVTESREAREALRRSEERFRALADNISQFAWMADEKGWIFWYNRRWFDYTGTSLEQVQGWGWKSIHHPDHADRVAAKFKSHIESGKEWEDTFPLRGRDGGYRWFLSRALPVRDEWGRILLWFGTNTDVTDQRRAEEALREADRRKNDFLATLAHELRNPLAPIRSAVQLLRLRADEDSVLSEAAEMIDRQARHMVRLIDDLMDVSRITRGKLRLRRGPVPLAEVVAQAVEVARPRIDGGGHALALDLPDEPVVLDADRERMAQVFANLLTNSAKYTEPGGRIRLSAQACGRELTVSVRDNGVGIAAEHLPRLFEMFSQADSALERSEGGLGIGLALVRGLVEMHGGSVEAFSEGPGRGSEFVVRLPLPEEAAASRVPPPPAAAGSALRGCRIVLADDNRDAALSMALLLRSIGCEVRTAHDGQEAVEAAEAWRPHLALLDIGMPRLNGYEAARLIRAREWGGGIVLVALTGWGQEEDRRASARAGFNVHLVKPVDFDELRAVVEAVYSPTRPGGG